VLVKAAQANVRLTSSFLGFIWICQRRTLFLLIVITYALLLRVQAWNPADWKLESGIWKLEGMDGRAMGYTLYILDNDVCFSRHNKEDWLCNLLSLTVKLLLFLC